MNLERSSKDKIDRDYADHLQHPHCKSSQPRDPWTEAADSELKTMWDEGISVADIAKHFGRKQSAIITRIKKLGL